MKVASRRAGGGAAQVAGVRACFGGQRVGRGGRSDGQRQQAKRETGEEREAFGRTAGSAGDAWCRPGPAAADGARSGAWRSGGEDEINWEGDRVCLEQRN